MGKRSARNPDIISNVRNKLKVRHLEAVKGFKDSYPHAHEFLENTGVELGKIRQHSTKLLTAGTISGALLLPAATSEDLSQNNRYTPNHTRQAAQTTTSPVLFPQPIANVLVDSGSALPDTPRNWMTNELSQVLPPITDRWGLPFLTRDEEKIAERIVSRATNIPARASLEGEHLNTIYGYIGAEQHLPRFAGDTVGQHDEHQEAGITPARGAWGYFTENGVLTQDAIMREKYYVAVQTLYLPDWNTRWKYLKDWYKWRKVMVVNPDNGNAVVAVVGDAGPASWTGKHFGGSPEVMHDLGGRRYKSGKVLLFFVDDPENKVPLGPVQYDQVQVPIIQAI